MGYITLRYVQLTLYLSLSHLLKADSQSLLQMICTAPSSSFTQTPSFPLTPPPFPPTNSIPLYPCHLEVPHTCHFTYFLIFSLLTLTGSPTETAPYGSACGRWQHGSLQLHSHGLDTHSTGHQDCQGYGRFGISLTSFDPIFHIFSFFLFPPLVQCSLLCLCWSQKPSALPDASPTVA